MNKPLRLTVQDLEVLTKFSDLNDAITEADILKQEVKFEDCSPLEAFNKANEIGRGRGRGRCQRISFDENFISRQLQEHIGIGRCQNQHQGGCHWFSSQTILSGPSSSGIKNLDTQMRV